MVNFFCAFALLLIVAPTKSADVRKNPLGIKVHDNADDPILCDKVEELIFQDSVPYISFHQVQSTLSDKNISINSDAYQQLKKECLEKIQQKRLLSYEKIMNDHDIVAPLKKAELSLIDFAANIEKDKLSADCLNRLTAHRKRLEKINPSDPNLISIKDIVICFHYNNDNPLTHKYSFYLKKPLKGIAKKHADLAFQQYAGSIRFISKKNTDKDSVTTSSNDSCKFRYIFQEGIPLPFQYERDIEGLVQVMKANIGNLIIGDDPSEETIK